MEEETGMELSLLSREKVVLLRLERSETDAGNWPVSD